MAQTWTIVKFCEENSVEAVPTTWLVGSDHCYWPPFTQDKVLQAIKRHDVLNTCWPLHKAEVFRCGTYDTYLQARNKAKKAEYESDLSSSDCDKLKRKLRHRKVVSSDEETELSGNELASSKDNTQKCYLSPPRLCVSSVPKQTNNPGDPSTSNCPEDPSTRNCLEYPRRRNVSAVSANSRTDMAKQTADVQTCSSCQQHNYDDALKAIQKQQILMRNILTQVLEELQQLRIIKSSEKEKNDESTSIFSKFHFLPINDEVQLNDVEEYLADERNFIATMNELSKLGGTNIYDFVKRCLNSLLSNTFAADFSWLGMKKKKVFMSLKLAKVLIGACDKTGLAENTKASEESIKKWLRRAKERSENELKKKNEKMGENEN